MVLPFAYPAFYQVNAVRGYSALQPQAIVNQREEEDIPLSWQADVVKAEKNTDGDLGFKQVSDGARFRLLATGEAAKVEVVREDLKKLTL
jgi:hypothetical protein